MIENDRDLSFLTAMACAMASVGIVIPDNVASWIVASVLAATFYGAIWLAWTSMEKKQ